MRLQLLSILLGSGSVVADSLFVFAPIVCGGSVFGPCSGMQYFSSRNNLAEEEGAGCFTQIVFLLSCGC